MEFGLTCIQRDFNMSIQIIKGNLLEADIQYICHQVNAKKRMGSGIAKSIREKWPIAYEEYIKWCEEVENKAIEMADAPWDTPDISELMLGHIKIAPVNNKQFVIHMMAQENFGYDGKRYTSYDAFWNCLEKIKEEVPKGSTLGFPWKIASDRGGANWTVIFAMIKEALSEDYKVQIYKLEE